MKELNEMELREVEGGMMTPGMWLLIQASLIVSGIIEGFKDNKL